MNARDPVTLIFLCWKEDVVQRRIDFVHALKTATHSLRRAFDVLNESLELSVPFVVTDEMSLADAQALAVRLDSFGAVLRVVPGDADVASSSAARALDDVRRRAREWKESLSYLDVNRRLQEELVEYQARVPG